VACLPTYPFFFIMSVISSSDDNTVWDKESLEGVESLDLGFAREFTRYAQVWQDGNVFSIEQEARYKLSLL